MRINSLPVLLSVFLLFLSCSKSSNPVSTQNKTFTPYYHVILQAGYALSTPDESFPVIASVSKYHEYLSGPNGESLSTGDFQFHFYFMSVNYNPFSAKIVFKFKPGCENWIYLNGMLPADSAEMIYSDSGKTVPTANFFVIFNIDSLAAKSAEATIRLTRESDSTVWEKDLVIQADSVFWK